MRGARDSDARCRCLLGPQNSARPWIVSAPPPDTDRADGPARRGIHGVGDTDSTAALDDYQGSERQKQTRRDGRNGLTRLDAGVPFPAPADRALNSFRGKGVRERQPPMHTRHVCTITYNTCTKKPLVRRAPAAPSFL